MTESSDTTTHYSSSDGDNGIDYPIDLFGAGIDQQEYIDDEFGLFYHVEDDQNDDDDADDEDNLTLFDLKNIPRSEHDLSVFDELAYQCDAVLLARTYPLESTLSTTDTHILSSKSLTTTMINDYERRFQRSLQKLSIPSWYNDPKRSSKLANKSTQSSTERPSRQQHRTPEIIHVQRPHSYRSCRSSLGTSPSPSAHSWHPNHFFDGMNFPSLLPSSSWGSRRSNKYEKGIERVTKSSHWYQPTQFTTSKTIERKSTNTTATTAVKNLEKNQNDQSRSSSYHSNFENRSKQCVNPNSRLTLQRQAHCFMDMEGDGDVENTTITKQHNNDHKGNIALTYDKQLGNHIQSNEIAQMPLADENIAFTRIELEEITDEDEADKQSSTSNIQILSTVEQFDANSTKTSLERFATHFVDSILAEALHSETARLHEDEQNHGVRELSDDENALRELDENDMSGTDEFILFATKSEDEIENLHDDHGLSPTTNNRGNLNRLYTFTRTNDDGTTTTVNSNKSPSNQDFSTSPSSALMIVDNDIPSENSHSNPNANLLLSLSNEYSTDSPPPIYRSHIQKRHINLGRYYDGMMRAKTSQLPTHDLRCNLALIEPYKALSPEGVTEETVRKGRILLDQMPDSLELKNQIDERPIRSILKQTRFSSPEQFSTSHSEDQSLVIEDKEKTPSRRTVTTITEEFHRIHRQIIEDIETGYPRSNNHEQVNTQEPLTSAVSRSDSSPYELLSECYSGYSFMRNKLSIPVQTSHLSNLSSLQSTTDEAYESEATVSPRSPTMSSSTVATNTTSVTPAITMTHVHPDLVHEFEYPSPPPPVPDRRLKPAHLRPPPPTKPRSQKPTDDPVLYSKVEKPTKTSPLRSIQHLISSTPTDSDFSSVRTLSSRHYCGTLPLTNEPMNSSSTNPTNRPIDDNANRNSKTRNSSSNDSTQIKFKKSSSTSFTKSKSKRSSASYFDEATNGLAIRLPVNQSNEQEDSFNKQNLIRSSTPSSTKRAEGSSKHRPVSEHLNSDRSSTYETSV